ncbi:MAG: MBL fold metallo-hydrolase [Bacteroidales bacterium]|nr:MBL fold metallo-hydrolase [Bacteroidales bacterium]
MIKTFVFNHYGVNCYLLVDGETKRCAVVDPAAETPSEDETLFRYIEANGLKVVLILLTHAHIDHIAGLMQCARHYGAVVALHADGKEWLRRATDYGAMMGFDVDEIKGIELREIVDGEWLEVGAMKVECRLVPGHCPGSMCYVVPSEKAVLTGDALFHMSIGRTDLPGGDYSLLVETLKEKVLTLPDDFRVLPGHGMASQVGKERKYNPFLR